MVFTYKNKKGQTYYLHFRDTPKTTLYYFAKTIKPKTSNGGPLDAVPAGRKVIESKKTGLPLLKKA
ncbi:MAG: hypothetical protein ABH829_00840 [archaeon]